VLDTVGEFHEKRTYAFRPTESKELAQLKLNAPTVSGSRRSEYEKRFADSPEWNQEKTFDEETSIDSLYFKVLITEEKGR